MKRLFSFSVTSTFTFILSVLAILVIAVSTPGIVQAVLGPAMAPTSPAGSTTQASPYYGPKVNPAANFGSLTDNGTAAYMGIGISTPVSPLHIYSTTSTQPETIDLDGAQPITAQWNDYSNTGGAFSGSGFLARFARGSKASPANVASGDRLGFNVFGGWAGTGFKHTGAIEAMVDSGTVSDTSLPTYMRFSTTPSGSVSRLERMRITPAGNVGIGTTNPTNGKLDVETSIGNGVYGSSDSSYGVYGSSKTSSGVIGTSDSSIGVEGDSNTGDAVRGFATSGSAIFGQSASGYGVFGQSTSGYAAYFDGKVAVNGSLATAYTSKTADYPATGNDSIIAADATSAAVNITLPSAAGIAGRTYTIKRIDSSIVHPVSVQRSGADTIDGATSYSLGSQWKYVTVVSTGSGWLIVANN